MLRWIWLFTLLLLTRTTFGQDIFPGDGFVPDNARNVHDPTIIHIGDRYLCFSTNGDGFGLIRSAPDLVHWTELGPVMRETPQWLVEKIPDHRSMWAPRPQRVGDGLRLYYCASEKYGANTSYIGLAKCPHFDPAHPTQGWRDLGMVLSSHAGMDNFNAIDPCVITDERKRSWMFYGSFYSGIYAIELDPASGKTLASAKPIAMARNPHEPYFAIEAPAVVHRGEYYYLFCSYGLSSLGVRSTYTIGVGRSKSIEVPFVDPDGKPMLDGGRATVLKSSPPMFGPGHCMAFEDDGRWLLVHHYYDGRAFWTGDMWGMPTLQVREIAWSDDGWPLPGRPVPGEASKPAKVRTPVGRWIHQVDFTDPFEALVNADGTVANSKNQHGHWILEGSKLTMRWPKIEDPGQTWVDTLYLSDDNSYYVGRNQTGLIIRGARKDTKP